MQRSSDVNSLFLFCHGHRKRAISWKSKRPNRGVTKPGRLGPRLGVCEVVIDSDRFVGGEVSGVSIAEVGSNDGVVSRDRSNTELCTELYPSKFDAVFRLEPLRRTAG